MSNDEEYWFSRESCFSCNGELKRETRNNARVLVCTKCGVINASVEVERNGTD